MSAGALRRDGGAGVAPRVWCGRGLLRGFGAVLVLVLVLLVMAGCASDKPKPTPLEPIKPAIAGREVWRARIASADYLVSVPPPAAVAAGAFVVGSAEGTVQALDALSGRVLWRGGFGGRLVTGPGSDGRFSAAVIEGNVLVVLDFQGRKLWDARLSSAVATAPLVAGERVFVAGVDRQVLAFDALDGRALWTYQRGGSEALTLAMPAVLSAHKNTLLVGQGAVLVGLEPTRGAVRSEVPLTPPRGTNEVERLNDLVGPPSRVGDLLCARAFQTAVGCVDLARNTLRWSRLAGGQKAVAADALRLYGADASDRVNAWKVDAGELAWTNERLLYRGLTAPLAVGGTVVFGDSLGQVHFLAGDDGRTLLRLPTDGSAIVAQPVLSGSTVLVITQSGGLYAFRPE